MYHFYIEFYNQDLKEWILVEPFLKKDKMSLKPVKFHLTNVEKHIVNKLYTEETLGKDPVVGIHKSVPEDVNTTILEYLYEDLYPITGTLFIEAHNKRRASVRWISYVDLLLHSYEATPCSEIEYLKDFLFHIECYLNLCLEENTWKNDRSNVRIVFWTDKQQKE